MNPKVVAVCLTRQRMEWLPTAIECFMAQTYPCVSMLIVADEDLPQEVMAIEGLISTSGARNIELVVARAGLTIGSKRNAGNASTACDVICHFDSDDFSDAGRVADQVGRLQSSGKAVTGYRTMRFTDGNQWWTYHGVPYFTLGTSLCYRRDWWDSHPFPDKHIQEDCAFMYAAQEAEQLVSAEAGDLMHATIHPGNTSCRASLGSNYVPCDPPPYWKVAA